MATLKPSANPSGQMDYWIIGDGGHGRDVLADERAKDKGGAYWRYLRVAHHHTEVDTRGLYIIAVNDPHLREQIALEMGIEDGSWIHRDASIYEEVVIGVGTHINYGAMMTRTTLGHHCTIAPGVHMAGDITIGDRVFVGIGATIGNLVTIGDDAIIGAGSVVLKDVAAGQKVLGVWA